MSMIITLPAVLEAKVKEVAARSGRSVSQLVIDTLEQSFSPAEETVLSTNQPSSARVETLLDWGYIAECTTKTDAPVTLEEVRQALSKIPNSMAGDFSAERDDR